MKTTNRLTTKSAYPIAAFLLALLLNAPATAGVVTTYDSAIAFNSAISGLDSTVCDFESSSAGDVIASGSSLCDMTFDYDLGGLPLTINDDFDTVSGNNYLGVDGGEFFLGDSFDITFGQSINAFGLFIITTIADVFPDDFTIANANVSANSNLSVQDTLPDGGEVLFLGLHDTDGFNSISFSTYTGCNGCVLFDIDDITYASATAVPSPASSTLFLLGFLALGVIRKRNARQQSS